MKEFKTLWASFHYFSILIRCIHLLWGVRVRGLLRKLKTFSYPNPHPHLLQKKKWKKWNKQFCTPNKYQKYFAEQYHYASENILFFKFHTPKISQSHPTVHKNWKLPPPLICEKCFNFINKRCFHINEIQGQYLMW